VNIWLFHIFTRHVGTRNQCFMSANTSSKRKLLLILEQSQIRSNAIDSRQHKYGPMFRFTKWIYEAIPCGPYLSHGALVEFSPCLGRLKDGTFRLYLSYLASSLKSIRENMILWFLNISHSSTLFDMWFLTSAQ
jgi:hypothetical protein